MHCSVAPPEVELTPLTQSLDPSDDLERVTEDLLRSAAHAPTHLASPNANGDEEGDQGLSNDRKQQRNDFKTSVPACGPVVAEEEIDPC
jgi:hypothetical protein